MPIMRVFESKKLGVKIFVLTMMFYIIIVIAVTGWLVLESFRSEKKSITRELQIYEHTFKTSAYSGESCHPFRRKVSTFSPILIPL
jgi:hypothetical protein